jgi:hypothetical protein
MFKLFYYSNNVDIFSNISFDIVFGYSTLKIIIKSPVTFSLVIPKLFIILRNSGGIIFPNLLFIINSRPSIYLTVKLNPQSDSFNDIVFLYIKSIPFLSNSVSLIILILTSISPLFELLNLFPFSFIVIISLLSMPLGIST